MRQSQQKYSPEMLRSTKLVGLVLGVGGLVFLGGVCAKTVPNTNVAANSNAGTNSSISNGNENTNSIEIDTSDWQTYTNEEYGFSFRYPGDWEIQTDEVSKNLGLSPKDFGRTQAGQTELMTILVQDVAYDVYLARESSESEVILRKEVMVNNQRATLEVGKSANFADNFQTYTYYSYIIPLKDKTLVFFLADDNQDYQRILSQIVQSLK